MSFLLPICIILGIFFITTFLLLVRSERKLKKTTKDLTHLKSIQKDTKIYKEHFIKLRDELQDFKGNKIREGLLERDIISSKGTSKEKGMKVILTVEETKRYFGSKVHIKIKDSCFPGEKNWEDGDCLDDLQKLFGGWCNDREIKWLESFDGREESLTMLLEESDK